MKGFRYLYQDYWKATACNRVTELQGYNGAWAHSLELYRDINIPWGFADIEKCYTSWSDKKHLALSNGAGTSRQIFSFMALVTLENKSTCMR